MSAKNLVLLVLFVIILIGFFVAGFALDLLVLTAVPIGLLFGFFMQKGDLCSASALSEVIAFRDGKKLFGFWVAIVVTMISFTILEVAGLQPLRPKPALWLNMLIGGFIFGIGMVLSGGCISGLLYKSASGNLNSMSGLVGVTLGLSMVEYGLLKDLNTAMSKYVSTTSNGDPLTLTTIFALPHWALTLIFLGVTISIGYFSNKKLKNNLHRNKKPIIKKIFFSNWKPWHAGIAIGILGFFGYLSSVESGRNYALGVSHGVLQFYQLLTENNLNFVYTKTLPKSLETVPKNIQKKSQATNPNSKKIVVWLILVVLSFVIGAWFSASMSGVANLLPKPTTQVITAFFGGILVGIGSGFATGCTIGNILSGWAMMSVGNFIFGFAVILGNWITTYFYILGGSLKATDFHSI